MYFNVKLKLLTELINSAFVGVCVNWLDFKMHGATMKIVQHFVCDLPDKLFF